MKYYNLYCLHSFTYKCIFQVSLENHSGAPENHRNSITKTISEPANGVPRLQAPPNGGVTDKRETRVTMSQLSPSQLHNVPLNDTSAASAQPHHPPATTQPVVRQGFCEFLLYYVISGLGKNNN